MKALLLDSPLGEIVMSAIAFLVGASLLYIVWLIRPPGGQVSYWSSIQQLNWDLIAFLGLATLGAMFVVAHLLGWF
jgi:uncharacterized membrane protein YdcZ (DUF606 family)